MENQKKRARKEENVWTDECEALLAEWSEKASCYRWLHGRCEKNYRKWYYYAVSNKKHNRTKFYT